MAPPLQAPSRVEIAETRDLRQAIKVAPVAAGGQNGFLADGERQTAPL